MLRCEFVIYFVGLVCCFSVVACSDCFRLLLIRVYNCLDICVVPVAGGCLGFVVLYTGCFAG